MKTLTELFEVYLEIRHSSIAPALEAKRKELEAVILGHPDSFDRVRCWMVDVHGTRVVDEAEFEVEAKTLARDLIEQGHAAIDRVGELAKDVHRFMSQRALVTDSGAGSNSWHYGAKCTDEEARELCKDLHLQFAIEIEKGVLRVERMPWSLSLVE